MNRKFFLKKFLFYFFLFFLPVALIGTAMSQYAYHNIYQSINDKTKNKYRQNVRYLTTTLDVFPYSGSLFNNSYILKRVIDKVIHVDSLSYVDSVCLGLITAIINNKANTSDFIDSIYLYSDNTQGNFISSGYGLSHLENQVHTEWLDIFHNTDPSVQMWICSYPSRFYPFEKKRNVVSVFYRLNRINGAIIVNMSESALKQMLDSFASSRDEIIFVTNGENQILFGNSKSSDFFEDEKNVLSFFSQEEHFSDENFCEININKRKYILMRSSDSTFGLHFYSIIAADVLYETPRRLLQVVGAIGTIMAVISAILSYQITRGNQQRIANVIAIIEDAKNGCCTVQKPQRKLDEYDAILNNLLDVFVHNNYLHLQLNQLELEKQIAEYRALQLQINPHFLFNTLQTISIRAMNAETTRGLSETVSNLSDILRYSLELSQPLVTLQEEITISKKYLEIQACRYPRRFYTIWEYDDSLAEQRVLRLIFQPMLENSLQHGLLPCNHPGLLKIRIEYVGGFLFVCFTDNGVGMTHEESASLMKQLENVSSLENQHIGLKNVYSRIKLQFGERAKLHIYSRKNVGTSISLAIPISSGAKVKETVVDGIDSNRVTSPHSS